MPKRYIQIIALTQEDNEPNSIGVSIYSGPLENRNDLEQLFEKKTLNKQYSSFIFKSFHNKKKQPLIPNCIIHFKHLKIKWARFH